MSERISRDVLGQLRAATTQLALYPLDHPATAEVLGKLRENANRLCKDTVGEVVLSILGDSLYENRSLLAHASLEYNIFSGTCRVVGSNPFPSSTRYLKVTSTTSLVLQPACRVIFRPVAPSG